MKKVAFIFPGQGSQSVGMGKDFFDNSDIAKEMVQKASERLDVDFEKLLFTGNFPSKDGTDQSSFEENDMLGQTQYTQPAILLVSCIALELFKEKCDITPEFVLGHSLGEFSALVASGAINYLDAVELVHKRGLFMNEACEGVGAGMMALVGLDDATVESLCEKLRGEGKKIWAANYNQDGQIVVAGIKADLEATSDQFKASGAKRAIVLDMSVASHCELLTSAIIKLEPYLHDFITDKFDTKIISNVTAESYESKDEAFDLLGKQLISPVKYKQSIAAISGDVDCFIEFGNGSVLKGLNRKIDKSTPTLNVSDMKSLEETLQSL